jgi:hypothetical protein
VLTVISLALGLFLQAALPVPQRVVLAFALDAAHDGVPIVVQTYQGSHVCANVQAMGNERQCEVVIVRPNMLRLSTIRRDGTFGQWSAFIEVPETGNGNGPPGMFRVTFVGEIRP